MKLRLNFPIAFVNGLRRSLISHVPSFSLNTKFIENETDYNNDVLKLRISLIPVKEHLTCELNIHNETSQVMRITSSHFENQHIMPDIFLFDLKPNQNINLECETERGYGYQNSKWQIIETPLMRIIEEICIQKHDIEQVKTIVPELITNNNLDQAKCFLDRTAVDKLNEIIPGIITFKPTGEYDLIFKSNGWYSDEYCLKHALKHLKQLFEKLDYEQVHDPKLKILKFYDRSYTFGNLLQYFLQKECSYATFNKPHHLENYIFIKFIGNMSILENVREKILVNLTQLEQFCI